MIYLVYYLIIINIIAFIIYGLDKLFAIKHMRRISEATLFFLALIGGEIGSYIGMKVFHHKTKKLSFRIIIPLVLLIHIVIVLYLLNVKNI